MQWTESISDCWVDVFEDDYFMGKRRRLSGPQKLHELEAKSLIVGPKAIVVLSVVNGKQKSEVKLTAKRVVADLKDLTGGAIFREVTVKAVE